MNHLQTSVRSGRAGHLVAHEEGTNCQQSKGQEVVDMAEDQQKKDAIKQNIVEKMWLHYFNNSLLEQGLITETQHRKMKVSINSRKASAMER